MAGVSFYNLPAVNIFDPSYLPNLEAWYKADAGITTVSGFVSVWADQSGNGRDVTQSTAANRPAYGSETLNGIDVLTFDGTDALNAAAVTTFNFLHKADSTVFIVARAGNVANPNTFYSYLGNTSGSGTSIGYEVSYDDRSSVPRNNALVQNVYNGTGAVNAVVSTATNDKITPNVVTRIAVVLDVDAAAGDRMDGYIDGIKYDGANIRTAAVSGSNATQALQIGAVGLNVGRLIGAIAEIIMYSQKLSDSEISKVDNYLKSKYAL